MNKKYREAKDRHAPPLGAAIARIPEVNAVLADPSLQGSRTHY